MADPKTPKKPCEEPYTYNDATIQVALTIRPDDGHTDGREFVFGVRSHDAPPILTLKRLPDVKMLPALFVEALKAWEDNLPNVQLAQIEAAAASKKKPKRAEATSNPPADPGQMSMFDAADDSKDSGQ